jgi:hypothetical protein
MAGLALNLLLLCLLLSAAAAAWGLGAALAVRLSRAEEARWRAALPGGELFNLPGELLHQRQRPFRLECIDTASGQPRAYTVLAKHTGAATMKAYAWGEHLRTVEELPTNTS